MQSEHFMLQCCIYTRLKLKTVLYCSYLNYLTSQTRTSEELKWAATAIVSNIYSRKYN